MQVRVRFGREPSAVVRSLELYYLPQNQRAIVHDVGLGAAATKNADAPPGATAPSTKLALSWSVDNPDRDALRFRLRFRADGRDRFLPLFGEEVELTEPSYTWDTTSVPDGWYVVEVEASDERANPATHVLRHRASSSPILVDNHAPDVEALDVQSGKVVGRALDAVGPIARLELSLDGGPFRDIYPDDGFLDSAREAFAIDLPADVPPPQIVAVRATDAAGNSRTVDREIRTTRP